ncbi:MAG: ABC transporter permease [Alphaproteobacteria bacterium]|nr:MAG: ABC transporter permease [Alphaproteobacteria bacterium]
MHKILKLGLWIGIIFLYFPILLLILFSFNEAHYPVVWTGFSLKWYQQLFSDKQLFHCLINSLKIATISATISTILGTLAAINIVKSRKNLLKHLLMMPLSTPEVIIGLSLLLFIVGIRKITGGPTYGMQTIIMGHITLTVGYTLVIIHARLKTFDAHLEEAASNLGATPLQTFYYVTLPIIMPALASGWFLSFALSLDDVVLASFLSGPGVTTLPMLVFSSIRMGITPKLNALATIITACVLLAVVIFSVKKFKN